MVAVAWLIAHAIIGSTGTPSTIARFFLKQEAWSVNIDRINKTHDSGGAKDMIEAPPLSLIAVGATSAVLSQSMTGQITDITTTFNLLQSRTVSGIVEVTGYENMGLRRTGTERVE